MRLKRTGILTKVVIVVLLVYLATSLLDLRSQIQNTKEQQQTVSQQVEEQRLANQQLQEPSTTAMTRKPGAAGPGAGLRQAGGDPVQRRGRLRH